MIEITSEKKMEIPAAADQVWDLLADFGGIAKWWPEGMLDKVECEGAGVGMVRHMHTLIGMVLSERLDALDREARTIHLSIVEGLPFGIEDYSAVGRVVPTGDDSCLLDWRGTYKIPNEGSETDARAVIEGAYEAQAAGLLGHFAK